MTRVLVRKELRDLLPWAILSVCIGLTDLAILLLRPFDMLPLGLTHRVLGEENGPVLWFMAFAIGTGLGTREQDDGTLAFLDGLPVSRSRVFFVKFAVMLALLCFAPLVASSSALLGHATSHGSLDANYRFDIVFASLGLQCVSIFGGLCLGSALGFLRSLTWLFAGLMGVALKLLVKEVPRAELLNPFALLDTSITSAGLSISSDVLYAQLGLSVLSLLVSWRMFLRAGRPTEWLDLRSRPVASALVTTFTVGALFGGFMLFASDFTSDEREDSDDIEGGYEEPTFAESPPAQTSTRHYHFSYPAHRSQQALALAAVADPIFERVHVLLGVPAGESIDVDASGSVTNTVGTAFFGRLRMDLRSDAPVVLAHESAHVIAQRVAGQERIELWSQATVLNEGLATWVERHFDPLPVEPSARPSANQIIETALARTARDSGKLVLAALHSRRELSIDELVDLDRLRLVRDDNLKYPAGEALIEAIVRRHGEPALTRLLRAFGEPSLPQNLRGLELWQTTCQLAGIDLAGVLDEFFRDVEREAKLRRDEIAALPRPRVLLVEQGAYVGVLALVDASEHTPALRSSVRLRFKPQTESPPDEYEVFDAVVGEPVWREPLEIQADQVCVQAGLDLGGDQVLYEPWNCLPVSNADTWREPEPEECQGNCPPP